MYSKKKKLILSFCQLFSGYSLLLHPDSFANAQEAQQVARVEVTGSSISRVAVEGALPIQTFSREDIQRSGATSVTELIQSLTSMQGYTTSSESVGGGGGGFAGASVHGIGETRTLVLLNGRRVSSWAGQSLTGAAAAIDLNSLPLSVVERVEVLTDGASALYGSDAIAGVINFILRSNLQEWDMTASVSYPKGGVGKQTSASLSKGFGDLQKDGYNLMFSLSRDHTNPMMASDRSFSSTGRIPFSSNGSNYMFLNGSVRSAPANWEIADPTWTRDAWGNAYLTATGKCPVGHFTNNANDTFCHFDYGSTVQINPEQQRDNLLLSFSKTLNDNHSFGVDLMGSKFALTSMIAPAPLDVLIPTSSPLYGIYGPGGSNPMATSGVQPGDDLYAYWRGSDVGGRVENDVTRSLHLALWVKGMVGAWDYQSSLTHSTNTWTQNYPGGWFLQSSVNAAIASGTFDPFLLASRNSAVVLNGLQFSGQYRTEKSTLDRYELRGSRELFAIGTQMAMLGAGFDIKRENVKYSPGLVAQGIGDNIAGDNGQEIPFDVSRKSWGAFTELNLPLSKQLEMTGSLRHDNYQDFGNTNNYKLATRYQPAKFMMFRASLGTGFRAPSVPQVSAGRQLYGVTGNPYSCPSAALAFVQEITPSAVCHPDGMQYDQVASGNTSLKPETSKQWTIGFQVDPFAGASFGADWWNVSIKNRIGQLTEGTIMSNQTAYLQNFTTVLDPGTGNRYLALYIPNENLGNESFSGIDVNAKLVHQFEMGKLTSIFHWTHMLKHNYQRVPGGSYYSDLGQYNDGSVTFRDIFRLSFNLARGPLSHTLTANYKSGYRDYSCTAVNCGAVRTYDPATDTIGDPVDMLDHKVKSYITYDWQTQYQYSKTTKLTFGILNLLNQDPPFTIKTDGGHQIGYDNRYTDPRGRTLYANASFKF